MFFKRVFHVVAILLVVGVVMTALYAWLGGAQVASAQDPQPDGPQKLLIPRWFLSAITLEGQTQNVPEQRATLQFQPDGQSNGLGGCNNFSASYQAGQDGSLRFSPIMATEMACADSMDLEQAYFQALARVDQFEVQGSKLTLRAADGSAELVFHMPPK